MSVSDTTIVTASGREFDLSAPTPGMISIFDIAASLSKQCRFTGHTKHFYSVAQHSVFVSDLCQSQHALVGLLHDATEAYVGDVSTPIKRQLGMKWYRDVEEDVWLAVAEKFNVDPVLPADIKRADALALALEGQALLHPVVRHWFEGSYPAYEEVAVGDPLYPGAAELQFLSRFSELCPDSVN